LSLLMPALNARIATPRTITPDELLIFTFLPVPGPNQKTVRSQRSNHVWDRKSILSV
jgi:hypothetical protein